VFINSEWSAFGNSGSGHVWNWARRSAGIPNWQHSDLGVQSAVKTNRLVSLSVTLVSLAKTAEPIEMPFGLKIWVDPGNHVLDGSPDPTMGRGNFGGKEWPIVKYRDTLRSPVRKWLNRSRCHLDCGLRLAQGIKSLGSGLGWAEGSTSSIIFARWRQCAHM